jgi:hypothetical protein
MHRIIFLILTFILLSNYSFAKEDSLDFKTVDYKTYGYYINQKWDSLIFLGELAIDLDIDYYYLRVRLGVAYYEKQKYLAACKHFQQALIFDSQSDFAMLYLYKSYIQLGREAEARLLFKSFSKALKSETKIPESYFVSQVYAEGGYLFSNNESKNKDIDLDGDANIYGETALSKDKYFFHFGLQHDIGKKVSIYHAYNNLTINYSRIVKGFNTEQVSSDIIIRQQEYYINAEWFMKKGFSLSPAFHLLSLKYTTNDIKADTNMRKHVASLALSKRFTNTQVSLFGTYSDFEESMQIQAGLLLTVYPFSNLKFYSTTGVVNKNNFTDNSPPGNGKKGNNATKRTVSSSFVFSELLGVKFYKNNWLEISATYGELKNYNEKNAMIVYDTPDKINYKLEANLFFQLNKKLRLTLGYQYWDLTGTYFVQNSFLPGDIRSFNTNYQNQLITGGLKWNL